MRDELAALEREETTKLARIRVIDSVLFNSPDANGTIYLQWTPPAEDVAARHRKEKGQIFPSLLPSSFCIFHLFASMEDVIVAPVTDADEAFRIESAMYPEDEAATLEKLRFRVANAGQFFLGVYQPGPLASLGIL